MSRNLKRSRENPVIPILKLHSEEQDYTLNNNETWPGSETELGTIEFL